ncbi:MAG TPA: PAS domain S-box protein [Burkholderiaceae bacterium]|nr:PAS domain S-box protein [Burkholderiaceae bacterium]
MQSSAIQYDALLLEHLPDATVVLTPSREVLHWNRGAELLFGFGCDEAIGRVIDELIVPPDSDASMARQVDETLNVGVSTSESLRRRKDGSLLYVDISTKRIDNPLGGPPLILSSKKDVTSLRLHRDAKLVEAQYGDFLELLPDGVVLINRTGHVVYANARTERMFGYGHRELIGVYVETLFPQLGTRVLGTGATRDLFGVHKTGHTFPTEITLSALNHKDTSLTIGSIRDISERLRAEKKFRDVLEAAPDPIVIVDSSGRMTVVNSQAERMFGYTRAEMLGQSVDILLPERYRGRHPMHRAKYFSRPTAGQLGPGLDLYARRKDGSEFPIELSLNPLETEEGLWVSSSIRDISDRKRFEQELREKNDELERANRAKDLFLASMSHELRTPLNAVIGFTGTLLMRLPGPLNDEQEKQLRIVQTSAKHLLSLISDLLDLARIDADKLELYPEPVKCKTLVHEIFTTLRPEAECKGIAFNCLLPRTDALIYADRRALTQIVINLVSNAIKFTQSGYVHLELVYVEREKNKSNIEIHVRDTGCGIRAEDQTKLFEAFSRIHSLDRSNSHGTGLGLHLSRKLARAMGGDIVLHSEAGRGSTFTLTL